MAEYKATTPFRFRLRTLVIVHALVAIVLCGYVLWHRAMDHFFQSVFAGSPGEVLDQEDWPAPLTELVESASSNGLEVENADVYRVANGLSIEYVWRMAASPELFEVTRQEYGLTPYTPPEAGRFRPQSGLPAWWDPSEGSGTRYYAANLRGEGWQFAAFHDEENGVVYVHFYDNW